MAMREGSSFVLPVETRSVVISLHTEMRERIFCLKREAGVGSVLGGPDGIVVILSIIEYLCRNKMASIGDNTPPGVVVVKPYVPEESGISIFQAVIIIFLIVILVVLIYISNTTFGTFSETFTDQIRYMPGVTSGGDGGTGNGLIINGSAFNTMDGSGALNNLIDRRLYNVRNSVGYEIHGTLDYFTEQIVGSVIDFNFSGEDGVVCVVDIRRENPDPKVCTSTVGQKCIVNKGEMEISGNGVLSGVRVDQRGSTSVNSDCFGWPLPK